LTYLLSDCPIFRDSAVSFDCAIFRDSRLSFDILPYRSILLSFDTERYLSIFNYRSFLLSFDNYRTIVCAVFRFLSNDSLAYLLITLKRLISATFDTPTTFDPHDGKAQEHPHEGNVRFDPHGGNFGKARSD
jgi:hypothetical protein